MGWTTVPLGYVGDWPLKMPPPRGTRASRGSPVRQTRFDEIVKSLREIDRVYLMHGTRATWVLADLSHDADDLSVRLELGD